MRTLAQALTRSLFALALVCAAAGLCAAATDRDSRIISARAGGVNVVEGDVTFRRAGEAGWRQLTKGDDLGTGDAVRTGAGGRVEILLNPGSYFRLAENSEMELTDAALETLSVLLARGSAVVEAMGYSARDLSFVISTPHARATVVSSGVYRFNVLGAEASEVIVQKGRALLGAGGTTVLKEGRVARVSRGGAVETAKWSKKGRDAFDQWSRGRAEELARANRKLQLRSVNALLARTDFDALFGTTRYMYSGLWLLDSMTGCYTFVPFGYAWGSPYGFWYEARVFMGSCLPCRNRSVLPHLGGRDARGGALFPPSLGGGNPGAGYGSDRGSTKSSFPVYDSKHAGHNMGGTRESKVITSAGGGSSSNSKGSGPKN